MSQWIRKLLMGQPMSRREFLSGTAGAAQQQGPVTQELLK